MNRFPSHQPDWAAQYAAIGHFVVEFEWICWLLRFHACSLLQMFGLTKWPLGEVILNQRVFTGEPLFACCASMVAECLGPEHALIAELEDLGRDFQDLCRIRNDLLHAFYFPGSNGVRTTRKDAPAGGNGEKDAPEKRRTRIQVLGGSIEELQGYVVAAATVKQKVKEFIPKVVDAIKADGLVAAHH